MALAQRRTHGAAEQTKEAETIPGTVNHLILDKGARDTLEERLMPGEPDTQIWKIAQRLTSLTMHRTKIKVSQGSKC